MFKREKRQKLILISKLVVLYMTSPHENCFWDETTNKIIEDLHFAKVLHQDLKHSQLEFTWQKHTQVTFLATWTVWIIPAVCTSYTYTSAPTATTYMLPSADHSKQDTALPLLVRFLQTTKTHFTEHQHNSTIILILLLIMLGKN